MSGAGSGGISGGAGYGGTNWGNPSGVPWALTTPSSPSYGVLNTNTGTGAGASAKKGGGSPSAGQLGGLAGAMGGAGGAPQGDPSMPSAQGAAFAPVYRGTPGFQRQFSQPLQTLNLPSILSALTGG